MNEDERLQDALNLLNGMERAKPHTYLLKKIERKIFTSETPIFTLHQLRIGAAVAIIVLFLNTFIVYHTMQVKNDMIEISSESIESDFCLISNYSLYDK